jgi:hypothetical protein
MREEEEGVGRDLPYVFTAGLGSDLALFMIKGEMTYFDMTECLQALNV